VKLPTAASEKEKADEKVRRRQRKLFMVRRVGEKMGIVRRRLRSIFLFWNGYNTKLGFYNKLMALLFFYFLYNAAKSIMKYPYLFLIECLAVYFLPHFILFN